MKNILVIIVMLALSFNSYAFSDDEDRKDILDSRQEILTKLYKEQSSIKNKIKKAAGYATFSNIGVNVIFFSAGGGTGVVHDNSSGNDTFMSMASAGVGIGWGIKDFRAVFIFHTKESMTKFVEEGWDFSGQADAAAKSGDKGGEASKAGTIVNGVEVYQMTETGIALQATLQGTKYWKNDDLN
ncbi:MAG: hypothetical protein MJK12_03820 [Colwellia sp.]|nr:hypothetical protein [Colwellia sp.]